MRMIHAAGYGEIAIAYSDSRADLPLLHAASHPVVVNPKESAVEGFRRVLPTGTPVLNWGCEGRAGTPDAGEQIPVEPGGARDSLRSEEHTSELQSLMRISYAVFCLKKKKQTSST